MNADRIIEAIRNITAETGYPPTAEELAYVLGITKKSVHSHLLGAKRSGLVRYDENECLVAS